MSALSWARCDRAITLMPQVLEEEYLQMSCLPLTGIVEAIALLFMLFTTLAIPIRNINYNAYL